MRRTVGSVGNTPVTQQSSLSVSSGATFTTIPRGGLTAEEKAAKKFVDNVGHVSFDALAFARFICSMGGNAMQDRLLTVARGIIASYANMHDAGIVTEHTSLAKKIHRVSK